MKNYELGNLITVLREAKGYSQFQLGILVGVSDKAVSKWENGNAVPRMSTYKLLAEVLEISLDELLSCGEKDTIPDQLPEKATASIREDKAEQKRVELHLRSGNSVMTSVGETISYVERAAEWGHTAIAITDLETTRGLPNATQAGPRNGIKIIPGCELRIVDQAGDSPESSYSVMVLAQNYSGIVNLNQLLTELFCQIRPAGRSCLTRKALEEHRKGLLFGCSCDSGEMVQALRNGADNETLASIASFYDYLEVQPPENECEDLEAAKKAVRRILATGNASGKPVIAVSNARFMDPEDAVCLDVLRYNAGEILSEKDPPLFFRTTDEMLEAFAFLGEESARQIVIAAPLAIANSIDNNGFLFPGSSDAEFRLTRSNAMDNVKNSATNKAAELYGSSLPVPVRKRLDAELEMIQAKGYATQYWYVSELIRKSEEEGYPTGTRGLIGSSLVAYLCDITPVNPLPPHYRCPSCHRSIFVSNPKYKTGLDLPEKKCPECGAEMLSDGFNIPWESLLGSDGKREPDIDLNIADVFRDRAEILLNEITGLNSQIRPGCYIGMDENYIRGLVDRYAKDRDPGINEMEKERIIQKSVWTYRYSTVHPGGIIIIPDGMEPTDFMPVESLPSNGKNYLVSHYDFYSMQDRLYKLDCLSHTTPTLLHLMREYSGADYRTIPLNDNRVISLFRSAAELTDRPERLLTPFGTYGIPEFNEEKTKELVAKTSPKTISDLIKILGFIHATGLWEDNIETLISLTSASAFAFPAHREDIMNDLMEHGIDSKTAFVIMDRTRKGKGPTDEHLRIMKSRRVSSAYIEVCEKIKYMFPKSHTAAYMIMDLQLAWYKLYYPLAFYHAWICVLKEHLKEGDMHLDERCLREEILRLRREEDKATDPLDLWEESCHFRLRILELLLEMRVRGFNPIEISCD